VETIKGLKERKLKEQTFKCKKLEYSFVENVLGTKTGR